MRTRAAVQLAAGQPLEVVEIDLADPGPDDVVVRMSAVGICGTDLHQVKGEWQRPTPIVLGHEGAGMIEAVGSNVDPGRIGEEVVLTWAASCRTCNDCRRGRPAACVPLHRAMAAGTLVGGATGMSYRGGPVYRGTATGALVDRLVVAGHLALPTGGDIPPAEAALLSCAALTGVGALLFAARPRARSIVLVIGLGGVGQFCIQGARLLDASLIIGVDPVESRRQLALQLGASHVVDPDNADDLISDIAPNGSDVALDVVGRAVTTATALRLTKSGGTTVIVGLPPAGEELRLDFGEFNRREKWLTGTMYGSENPAGALPQLLAYVRSGRLNLAAMTGQRYPLDRVNEALEASMAGSPTRVIVTPN